MMPIADPVRYSENVEHPVQDEDETIAGLQATFRKIQDITSTDYDHAVRGVHAKGHAVATGTFSVHGDLHPELAQGLFAEPASYDAIIRISTGTGDIMDDAVSAPRGMALKLLDVPGVRLPDANEGDQDFLMSNGPVFGAKTPADFLKNLKLVAATTDKGEGLKKAWSATMRTLEGALEVVGGQSMLISQLGGVPGTHPLGDTYFSQAPFRYGDYMAKFSLVPVSAALKEIEGDKIKLRGRPDALREELGRILIERGARWEFRVQLCRDLEKMPIEDPTVAWNVGHSPYVTVATLDIAPQVGWKHGVSERSEDVLSFSPWHGLAAHQPLGAVNRARKPVYESSSGYRGDFNSCPVHDVRSLDDLPS